MSALLRTALFYSYATRLMNQQRLQQGLQEAEAEQQEAELPFRPVVVGKEMTLVVGALNAELRCPVCLNIIQKATCIIDCLHRFCFECIASAFSRKRQCPSCRQQLPSQ
jgi:hypothetical protein